MDEGDTHEKCILKELIDYTKPGQKNENWSGICKNERNQYGPIQKIKSVSTRMVGYEFEMVERFLEKFNVLRHPNKISAFGTVSLPIHVCIENCAEKCSKYRCVQCLHRKCPFE